VTATHIVYARRLAALEYAAKHGPSAAAAVFGVTRQTITKWRNLAQRYGLSALLPKARRSPVMPNQMPPDKVSAILAEAVANPTLGARQLLVLLAAGVSTARRRGCRRCWCLIEPPPPGHPGSPGPGGQRWLRSPRPRPEW